MIREWSKYNGNHVVFWPRRLSPERLQEGFRYILREAYSWRGILRRLTRPHRHSLLFGFMNLIFRRGVRRYLARTARV